MKLRTEALVASIVAVAVAVAVAVTVMAAAGVAAFTLLDPAPEYALTDTRERPISEVPHESGGVLAGIPDQTRPPQPSMSAATAATPAPAPVDQVVGVGSNYPGTVGWMGQATVALPGAIGGRYTGEVNGYVTVCADRCARLPVVDWCQCYWGTGDQRVVDLSHAAWAVISDRPLSTGLLEVRLILEG